MALEEDEVPIWMTEMAHLSLSLILWTVLVTLMPPFQPERLSAYTIGSLNKTICQWKRRHSSTRLLAAGYVLYSSDTIMGIGFGSGTHAFTLDHSTGEFVLTHPCIQMPPRGQIYSVNDARYFDRPDGLRQYIDTVRQGKGQLPKKYSACYICPLVADFHRTLINGGVVMNPRDHLHFVYEANPLSFLVEHAGGRGSDGKIRILSIQPLKLHQRLPLFIGSLEDMHELESYDNIQLKVNPRYEV